MILSLDAKVSAPSCQAQLFQLFLNQRVSQSYCAVMLSSRGLDSILRDPGSISNRFADRWSSHSIQQALQTPDSPDS